MKLPTLYLSKITEPSHAWSHVVLAAMPGGKLRVIASVFHNDGGKTRYLVTLRRADGHIWDRKVSYGDWTESVNAGCHKVSSILSTVRRLLLDSCTEGLHELSVAPVIGGSSEGME